jgi:hypothetical protein
MKEDEGSGAHERFPTVTEANGRGRTRWGRKCWASTDTAVYLLPSSERPIHSMEAPPFVVINNYTLHTAQATSLTSHNLQLQWTTIETKKDNGVACVLERTIVDWWWRAFACRLESDGGVASFDVDGNNHLFPQPLHSGRCF